MSTQKSSIILSFASLTLLTLLTSSALATGITGNTYVNDEYGFQISLPDDLDEWAITDQNPDLGLIVIEGPFGFMSIVVEPMDEPMPLEDLIELSLLFMPFMWDEFVLESEEIVQVGGVEAYEIVYTAELESFPMRSMDYVFYGGNYVYTIYCTGIGGPFPFPFDDFRSIVATFKFLDAISGASAPVIDSEALVFAKEGMMYIYDVQASDIDGDALTYSLITAPTGMTIDPSTGMIVWSPSATQSGPHPVTVKVIDGHGGTDTQSFTIDVNDAINVPPLITSTPVTAATEGESYAYQVEVMDGDNDALTYSLTVFPNWMIIDESTGLISWTPSGTQAGSHDVIVEVSDGRDGSVTQSFTIDVAEGVNNAPIITSVPLTTATEGVLYQYDVEATDADNDTLTFSLVTFPDGVSIDANTGLVSWTPTDAQVGNSNLVIQVSDGRDGVEKQSFAVSVAGYNTSPEAQSLIMSPESPCTAEDITCNYVYADADGDPESGSEIRWYKDGELQESCNDQNLVPSDLTAEGQQWHFTVKPKDGTEFGDLQTSDPVTIVGTKGDVNGDGELRSNDAILTLRIKAGLMEPTDQQEQAADMNGDGSIRSNDAILMLREIAGLTAPGIGITQNANVSRHITVALAEVHGIARERVTVPLKVDNIQALAGGDISIVYDSAVLRPVDVLPRASVLLASNITEPGIVKIAFACASKMNSKTIAEIRFDVIADDLSPLMLKNAELYGFDSLPLISKCIDEKFSSWAMLPEHSILLQNFPNPFNPETWIPYKLRNGSEVTIRIYSVSGRLIRELDLGYRPAGVYISPDRAAHWDGRDDCGASVASGTYFYSIRGGDLNAVRKMTVLK